MTQFRLEVQMPCNDEWCEAKSPTYYSHDWDTGDHDGLWEAETEQEVVEQFCAAWPNRHPRAKPYKRYRVTRADAQRTFRVVEEIT